MPSIASSATGSTSSISGSTFAPNGPVPRPGSPGASVDGRSRAPEAARPQGGRATAVGRKSTEPPSLNPAAARGLDEWIPGDADGAVLLDIVQCPVAEGVQDAFDPASDS